MRRVTLLLVVVAAFGAPVAAHGASYIALTVTPTQVASGWTLSATVTNGSFARGDEIVGLTLRRTFLGGRGEELHALRAHPKQTTIRFDGQHGRWAATSRLEGAATVDLALEATGPGAEVADAWGCLGAFRRIPVVLRGTLALRTGTRYFKTIRRTRLAGFVTIDGGPVTCDVPPAATCEPSTTLHAGWLAGSLLASPRRLGITFRQAVAGSAAWYHVLAVSGYDVLAGTPPAVEVAGPGLPTIRGSARFTGQTTKETSSGACRTTSTSGAATGSFRASFIGWGARTLRLGPGVAASFNETR